MTDEMREWLRAFTPSPEAERKLRELGIQTPRRVDELLPVGETATPASGMTVSFGDLEAAVATIKAAQPVATTIWFVDRPNDYYAFLNSTGMTTSRFLVGGYYRVLGIKIYNWEKRFFDAENEIIAGREDNRRDLIQKYPDKVIWPWFCNEPGIWVELSDGRVERFS